jgi:hypothetical protein
MDSSGRDDRPWILDHCYPNSYTVGYFYRDYPLAMQLTVCRTKRVQNAVLVCCRRMILACLEVMAKILTQQELHRLRIQAQIFPDPLSLTRKLAKRDLHFIFTSRDLPMQFPRRNFLATIPHKYLPPSVTMFFASLERIRTRRARILRPQVHPLNDGMPR